MPEPTSAAQPLAQRVASWFGLDSGWERLPADDATTRRRDAVVALSFLALAMLGVELLRSGDMLGEIPGPPVIPHLVVASGTIPLALRRRYPLTIAGVLSLHMLVTGLTMPGVMASFPMQVAYFFAIFTGVAWARDRRAMLVVVGGVIVVMAAWLVWQFAVGSGIEDITMRDGEPLPHQGLFSPFGSFLVYTLLINGLYFGGALVGGQAAWCAAQQRELLARQATTIERQARDLQRQAVIEERLRIARELHDVVAHHISVIGIQAAAARKVLATDQATAEQALRSVEQSSREAVSQMRGLLGTLRADGHDAAADRAPEPGLADIPSLAESSSATGLLVTCTLVEDSPGALQQVPPPVGLSLHRTVQEALANVRRHSTATRADVVVRVDRRGDSTFPGGYAEVEVLDAGRPRSGTSGSGLGLLGIRERLATHGGVSEIGPRVTGGYRVRVRMPIGSLGDAGRAPGRLETTS